MHGGWSEGALLGGLLPVVVCNKGLLLHYNTSVVLFVTKYIDIYFFTLYFNIVKLLFIAARFIFMPG